MQKFIHFPLYIRNEIFKIHRNNIKMFEFFIRYNNESLMMVFFN